MKALGAKSVASYGSVYIEYILPFHIDLHDFLFYLVVRVCILTK